MVMPVNQKCPKCGNWFMGSDCIGGPCSDCCAAERMKEDSLSFKAAYKGRDANEVARKKVAEFDRCSDTDLSIADRQWLLRAFVEVIQQAKGQS